MAHAPRQAHSDLAYLCRALKAPSLAAAVERLAERARAENWTHEEFLAACLEREVASRQDHGGENRIRAARFPARKTLEDFDFDHQRSLKRDVIAHLGTLDFVDAKDNVVFLGPPGTGKTHLATGLGIRACQAGHRVAFATAAEWVARLGDAHHQGRLHAELTRLGRVPLLVIDEVGYIPFDGEAANLFFQLVSARYERAVGHRHLQQALRPLGRGLRRRHRRRRHDRPPRPPRRGRQPQRRQLPAQGPRPREGAHRRRSVTTTRGGGSKVDRRQGVKSATVVDNSSTSTIGDAPA